MLNTGNLRMPAIAGLIIAGVWMAGSQAEAQEYTFDNVRIVGGGFITGIVADSPLPGRVLCPDRHWRRLPLGDAG